MIKPDEYWHKVFIMPCEPYCVLLALPLYQSRQVNGVMKLFACMFIATVCALVLVWFQAKYENYNVSVIFFCSIILLAVTIRKHFH